MWYLRKYIQGTTLAGNESNEWRRQSLINELKVDVFSIFDNSALITTNTIMHYLESGTLCNNRCRYWMYKLYKH